QQILEVANTAASQDVRLLLTPELSLCGYFKNLLSVTCNITNGGVELSDRNLHHFCLFFIV
ncbi:MAG: hypothetical protein F6K56_25955, partial [Moorea sp. SIO3G5]|nr:hypothetical protein [Moorena sp. SIO3G5]